MVTDASGSVVEESDFYPFGGEIVITDTLDNNYKFTDKERDAETGLDYFIARHYSSNLGRFLQPDGVALSLDISNPQSWNSYAYTFNQPTRMTDPDGQWPTEFHHRVVIQAFQRDFGTPATEAITRGDDWVDSMPNQVTGRSYMHSMRDGDVGQTVEDAQRMANDYIEAELAAAVQLHVEYQLAGGEGYLPAAMERLGHAVHTAVDATSPQHVGFQPWYGFNSWSSYAHYRDENRSVTSSAARDARARHDAYVAAQNIRNRFLRSLKKVWTEEEEKKKKKKQPAQTKKGG